MTQIKYIADVQILRAVAVGLVLVHHYDGLLVGAPIIDAKHGFYAGVDLFFCISGFVIGLMLFTGMKASGASRPSFGFRQFWMGRLWRLAPSMLFWLGIMAWKSAEFSDKDSFIATLQDAAAALFQVMNLRAYSCVAQNISCGDGTIFWTLSLEFQFYLFLSVLLFFAPARWWIPLLVLMLGVQAIIPHNHWQNLLSFIRTDAFILGVLLAYAKTYWRLYERIRPDFLQNRWLSLLVISLLIGALSVAGNYVYFPIGYRTQCVAVISALLVWIASYNQHYIFHFSLLRPAMLWVGSRSYALYLCHPFIWGMLWWHTRPLEALVSPPVYMAGLAACGLLAVMLVAEINYQLIETRFRKWASGGRALRRSGPRHHTPF